MELEEWIQQDMKRFLNERSPQQKKKTPVRVEDAGIIENRDYDVLIKTALQENRYRRAQELFKELRNKYMEVPLDHQQERRQYYRLLQRCYKYIYDYVADSHKTARIISQLEYKADVFDSSVASINVDDLGKNTQAVKPIEVVMVKMPQQPQELPVEPLPVQPPEEVAENREGGVPDLPPALPEEPQPEEATVLRGFDTQEENALDVENMTIPETRKDLLESIQKAPPPKWTPPDPNTPLDRRAKEIEEPSPVNEEQIQSRTARELVRQAHVLLIDKNLEQAQQKLMEARIELERLGGDPLLLRRITKLERSVAIHLHPHARTREDQEIFSKAYLAGVQAMAAGDYRKAAYYFLQRCQQTPHDKAAQIRLKECMEVLYGQSH